MGTARVENHLDQAVRPTYEELWEENRQLKRQVEKLTRLVEKLSREGRRQAAPFRKQDQPTRKPNKPGRKSGRRHGRHAQREVPARIDENYDVPLPEQCPHCGGQHMKETHVVVQYQTEIPRTVIYRQFDIHVGRCDGCGRAVQGRHPLQTSAACGAAASQLGPNVHAAFTILNKQLGLSHGKSVRLLTMHPTRGRGPAAQLLGLDWQGTLVHDGWSVYDRFTHAWHQQCLRHLQRRCQALLETASRGAARFPRNVLALIDQAFSLRRAWRGHRLSGDVLAEQGLALSARLERLASGRLTYAPNQRLAAHLLKHAMHWFWFLIDPTIAATNYLAEQAIRPAVVNRKVWGGNRTWTGAATQSILMSVLQTCQQRALNAFEFLLAALCRPEAQPLSA
jgi:hypothetical protein